MRSTGTAWSMACRPEVRNENTEEMKTQEHEISNSRKPGKIRKLMLVLNRILQLLINAEVRKECVEWYILKCFLSFHFILSIEFDPNLEIKRAALHLFSIFPAAVSIFHSQCMSQVLWCFLFSCRAQTEARADNEEPDGHGSTDPHPGAAEVTGGPSAV